MLISVIIPAFKEEKYIENIRISLDENGRVDLKWEIIVCDNNSDDNTAKIASKTGTKVIFEPTRQISSVRNTGARSANGKWILFCV